MEKGEQHRGAHIEEWNVPVSGQRRTRLDTVLGVEASRTRAGETLRTGRRRDIEDSMEDGVKARRTRVWPMPVG